MSSAASWCPPLTHIDCSEVASRSVDADRAPAVWPCVSPVPGRELLAAGIPAATLRAWSNDPAVAFQGQQRAVFDLHEELDPSACTSMALAVYKEVMTAPSDAQGSHEL